MPPTGDNENRQDITLLLVAGPHHLAGPDVRALLSFLEEQKHTFNISFSIADPQKQPELLELHRLVATPALIKLDPAPKQVFAGNAIQRQLQNWLPRWQQLGMVSGLSSSLTPSDTAGGTSQREMQLEDQLLVLRQENETLPQLTTATATRAAAWCCTKVAKTTTTLLLYSFQSLKFLSLGKRI